MSNVHKLSVEPTLSFGQVLRTELARCDLSQKDLADRLKISRASVNNLINNKYDASRPIANGLAKEFDRTVDFWLKTEFSERDLVRIDPDQPTSAFGKNFGRLSNSGIENMVNKGHLGIEPFDSNLIQPASIDLRSGKLVTNSAGKQIDIENVAYWLAPEETILLETEEKLRLPSDIAGNIGGMARYTRQFIAYGIGYEIDPGFHGSLGFTLRNNGQRPFRVSAGMPIITVMFYLLAEQSSQEWVDPTIHTTRLLRAKNGNGLRSSIKRAFENSYQSAVRQGAIEHSVRGTNLRFQTREEIEEDIRFSMFLDEISAIHQIIVAPVDPDTDDARFKKYDQIWEFLDAIEISIGDLLTDQKNLQPLLDECDEQQVQNWKNTLADEDTSEKTTIGRQTDILGVSSMAIILQLFGRRQNG